MTTPHELSLKEQEELNNRLQRAAEKGDTKTVLEQLAAGADVHQRNNWALRGAAYDGYTETVKILLAAGTDVHAQDDDVHAQDDLGLCWAAVRGHSETVQVLAAHIFAPDSWRGKNLAEIQAQASVLYEEIKATTTDLQPERLRKAGTILADYALRCWEQVRPAPPRIQIGSLPVQPMPL